MKILSIDGGGIRGIVPAILLERLHKMLDVDLADHFDIITGTSTGSIIACALAKRIIPKEITKLYTERGRKIFPYKSMMSLKRLRLLFANGISAPKFSNRGLIRELKAVMGDTLLSDIKDVRIIIPFYDTISRTTHYLTNDDDVPLWEAAVCSSSAPTFFPAYDLRIGDRRYSAIDGGVAANNPILLAVSEAAERPEVLSLGTGNDCKSISLADAQEWGMVEWLPSLPSVLMDASLDVQQHIAEKMADVTRIQFDLEGDAGMDDATDENIAYLTSIANRLDIRWCN